MSLAFRLPAHVALVFPELSLFQPETQPMHLKMFLSLKAGLKLQVQHSHSVGVHVFLQVKEDELLCIVSVQIRLGICGNIQYTLRSD